MNDLLSNLYGRGSENKLNKIQLNNAKEKKKDEKSTNLLSGSVETSREQNGNENMLHRNLKLTVYLLTATITNEYVVNLTRHEEFSLNIKTYNSPMHEYHFSSREKQRSQDHKLNSKPH